MRQRLLAGTRADGALLLARNDRLDSDSNWLKETFGMLGTNGIVMVWLAVAGTLLGCGEGTLARRTAVGSCATEQVQCDGSCVSLADNPAHCGSCNQPCRDTQACVGGICVETAEVAPLTNSNQHDAYDGGRGAGFNHGWRFHLGEASAAEVPSYDDASWRRLDLPHDYSIERPFNPNSPAGRGGGYLDGGIGWYRKRFFVPESNVGKRVTIQFDGVYMDSSVWLNGKLLGNRPYGYSSFTFDLTEALHFGTEPNVIAVRVNHQQPSSRWYSGSGIYRNVWLTLLHPVHVANSGAFVHFGGFTKGTSPAVVPSAATASVSVDVVNQSDSPQLVSVATTIRDADATIVATEVGPALTIAASSQANFRPKLTVTEPHYWSPVSPYLYQTQIDVSIDGNVVDSYRMNSGIRYLHFDPERGLFFNGQPLKIFGAALHDDLGALGVAFNTRAMERRVQLLKSMGANAIRTAHNPPAPELLELCDRLGMLVMDEAFDCWESAKSQFDYARFFNDWAETDLRDMVRRDRNHPSVFLWSVGNEIPNPSLGTATKLSQWVREEDTTRPVTWARESMDAADHQQITDQAFDLAGFNYPAPALFDTLHAKYPSWSCFGSEVMSGRMSRGIYVFPAGQRNLKTIPDWGSSYDNCTSRQAMGHDADFQVYEERPYLFGRFIWAGFDYLGEIDWPLKSNTDGKIDTAGFPKDAYYIYQSRLTTKPMVHLLPHWNWKVGGSYFYTEPNPGTDVMPLLESPIPDAFPVSVVAYTNCEELELFLNGTSLGTQRCPPTGAGRCQWEVPWEPGTISVQGRIAGQVVATDEVSTASESARIALSVDRDHIAADGLDLSFVTADVRDIRGTAVLDARDLITFSVTGPGEVVGVDNGDPSDTDEPYHGSARRAFAGKCLAIVRATGEGTITVSVSSGALLANAVSISSRAP